MSSGSGFIFSNAHWYAENIDFAPATRETFILHLHKNPISLSKVEDISSLDRVHIIACMFIYYNI